MLIHISFKYKAFIQSKQGWMQSTSYVAIEDLNQFKVEILNGVEVLP